MGAVPVRRSRSNDLRAMEAFRRIHATLGDRVVAPGPDPGADTRPRRPRPPRDPAPPRQLRNRRLPNLERPRPAGPVLTATAVLALLALLALGIGRLVVGGPSGSGAAPGPGRPAAAATTGAAGRSAGRVPTTPAAARRGTRGGKTKGPTAATPPPAAVITPRSADAAGATFQVPTASFTVELATTGGPCWVEVGPTASGPFSFAGTMAAGQHQAFPASNELWVRLGAPGNVSVTVDGSALRIDASGATPYNLTFTAAGA